MRHRGLCPVNYDGHGPATVEAVDDPRRTSGQLIERALLAATAGASDDKAGHSEARRRVFKHHDRCPDDSTWHVLLPLLPTVWSLVQMIYECHTHDVTNPRIHRRVHRFDDSAPGATGRLTKTEEKRLTAN